VLDALDAELGLPCMLPEAGSSKPLTPLAKIYIKGVERAAEISPCGKFRRSLSRVWDKSLPLVLYIMLNPSTADALVDDATIRRCMSFAYQEGYGGILVWNLFDYRAASPKVLAKARMDYDISGGPANEDALKRMLARVDKVVMAWGSSFSVVQTRATVSWLNWFLTCHAQTISTRCLGYTKSGQPKHPLYLPLNTPLIPWTMKG